MNVSIIIKPSINSVLIILEMSLQSSTRYEKMNVSFITKTIKHLVRFSIFCISSFLKEFKKDITISHIPVGACIMFLLIKDRP